MSFLVFSGENYYPSGGWNDLQSCHDTREEAVAAAIAILRDGIPVGNSMWDQDWAQVVDMQTRTVIEDLRTVGGKPSRYVYDESGRRRMEPV